jgi:murein DD-endopeptidase MepM/ murein hydrolase activator NlpD
MATAVGSVAFATLPDAPEPLPQAQHLALTPNGLGASADASPLAEPLAFAPIQDETGGTASGETPTADTSGTPWQSYTLKAGETLSQLGERTGIGARDALALAKASQEVFPARRMRPGHQVRVRFGEDGEPEAVRYQIDERRYLAWVHTDSGFQASVEKHPVTIHVQEAFGRVKTSLMQAGGDAGLPEQVTMELARIYGWDIDFAHDLRRGDWFRVLYQEIYREGERIGTGDILAAEFVTRGESHRAIRFTDADGRSDYYHPNGRSVRKAFLRNPVKFTRITSRFSRARDHPLLEGRRAHEGVDYGASTGTPVRATGDGRVVFRGRQGGYGRVVKLRHAGGRYTTVYAHLSRFARHAHDGQRVEQGQVVGYVGQSGLATGPHLHYEFQVRGNPRNPLKVELPRARPLPDKYRDAFDRKRHHLVAWLEAVGPETTRVARQEEGEPAS